MINERNGRAGLLSRLVANWFTLGGSVVIVTGVVIFGFLFAIESLADEPRAYLGVVFIFLPPVMLLGVILLIFGIWLDRQMRTLEKDHKPRGRWRRLFDLRRTESQQRLLLLTAVFSTVFVFTMAVIGFRAYEFTESTSFCGETCHEVMGPQYTSYQVSPHARVACAECHVGPGAGWYVRSKLSGAYQIYAYTARVFPRPIETPISNLRPAQDTCEHCHWPEKFYGGIQKTYRYFLSDGDPEPWDIEMLLKIGGGGGNGRRAEGIHWHVSDNHLVEYRARDRRRLDIPWVRVTDPDGSVTVYANQDEPPDDAFLAEAEIRQMDCLDCHNRPSHTYRAPVDLVNDAMANGLLPVDSPDLKTAALEVLAAEYETSDEGHAAISEAVQSALDGASEASTEQAVETVTALFDQNVFPEMKTRWDEFPDHSSHWYFPGCFRCHAGNMVSESGETISSGCDTCHVIVAQGRRSQNWQSDAAGVPFLHPADEEVYDEPPILCNDCHNGSLGY